MAHFFHPFRETVQPESLPKRFTFPFYYEPHELAVKAAAELQEYLKKEQEFDHNFGLEEGQDGLVIGKMFGVLVVKNPEGEMGALWAFSGKLGGKNHHEGFVPPVFDMLTDDGFFRQEEKVLNTLNRQIETLENAAELRVLKNQFNIRTDEVEEILKAGREALKRTKNERQQQRNQAMLEGWSEEKLFELNEVLKKQSISGQYHYKQLSRELKAELEALEVQLEEKLEQIRLLKEERRQKSGILQEQLFQQYTFLNASGKEKSLKDLFLHTADARPPAGAGECAAPKLLQFAFLNQLEPVVMAEFWWGQSPKSEVRVHGNFYPACRGKCEPILGHMLSATSVDPNPMLVNPAEGKELPVVYEDDYLLVVNKPAEFLSVPGKTISDSVYERIKARYPEATGPLIVHRLDMSTSGLLVIAKTKDIHRNLQFQFTKRYVKKRYVALLEGEVSGENGTIDLPLRVDLDDRPRQMVCYEYGKPAVTRWELIELKNGNTKVYFYPETGRTHQLRVHAAHTLGLNTPIKGDDLYGKKADRLYLHAERLEFRHPVTKEMLVIQAEAEF